MGTPAILPMSESRPGETEAVIPPSSLFVFWPGESVPLAEEVRMRLAAWGSPERDLDSPAAEDTFWSFWFRRKDRQVSYLIWCEPVLGEHLALLENVRWRSASQRHEALGCRWLVGVEGPLCLDQPTADYQAQLRLCDAISADWSPVFFDASSLIFRTAQDLRHLTDTRTPPRIASLYSIHKVASGRGADGENLYWLHTHGLERSGTPDLELFGVPERLLASACELIDAVADLWVEFGTPDPQSPFAIGRELEICWRPWQAVVAESSPRVGGWDTRRREPGHAGYRAVLLDPYRTATAPRHWRAPLSVLERLLRSETTLYKTTSETERMARLARERWGSFGTLFASRHPDDWRFAIKLNFPMEHDPNHGEHLWFDCLAIQPGRVQGRLVSAPAFLRTLSIGESSWHDLDRLSDWRIFTPEGVYDPETADALLE